jgi:predicted amino acid-binding ACT domain protein
LPGISEGDSLAEEISSPFRIVIANRLTSVLQSLQMNLKNVKQIIIQTFLRIQILQSMKIKDISAVWEEEERLLKSIDSGDACPI